MATIKRLLPWVMAALCVVLILAIFAIVFSAYVWAADAPGSIPPVPEPPGWDRSSLSVTGACVDRKPEFVIANHGSGNMSGPAYYWLLNVGGGASTCFTDLANAGYIYSGTVELASGQSVTLQYDLAGTGYTPPYRLCVEQRKGHPGVGWASATAEPSSACQEPTALEPGGEPEFLRRLYLPMTAR